MQKGKVKDEGKKKYAECDHMERTSPYFFLSLWHDTEEGFEVYLFPYIPIYIS